MTAAMPIVHVVDDDACFPNGHRSASWMPASRPLYGRSVPQCDVDFFQKRSINYNKRSASVTSADLF